MGLNRKIWLNWKTKKPCPTCETGVLLSNNKANQLRNETNKSEEMNSYGGYYYSDYVFSIHYECSECKETVVASGEMSEENYPSDEEIGIQRSFMPVSFYPPPKIISIPKSCPKPVSKVLNKSFGLYWMDLSSCANKIRIVVEVLLDELNVPKQHQTKTGLRDTQLHQRIEVYEKMNPEVGGFLLAIKWIGNAGSHYADVTKENILDAYELLEYSLEQLYTDKKDALVKLRDEINQTKKPRKK